MRGGRGDDNRSIFAPLQFQRFCLFQHRFTVQVSPSFGRALSREEEGW